MMLQESFYQVGKAQARHSLIVDTSDKRGFMLLFDKEKQGFIYVQSWEHPEKHSDKITQVFADLQKSHKTLNLSFILFVHGPGSFTGLRVGAAFVKALSFSLGDVPVITISKFMITAKQVIEEHKNLDDFKIVIPSIGERLFMADFFKDSSGLWHEKIDLSGAHKRNFNSRNRVFITERSIKYKDIEEVKYSQKTFENFLKDTKLSKDFFNVVKYLDLYPMYLRQSEAEEKRRYDKT